jgi:nitroreductase
MSAESIKGIDLASVDRVLRTTRTVRQRLDLERPVPPEIIEECIDIAFQAPTGANSQTWRFVVVTDAEKRAKLGELYRKGSELYLAGKTGLTRTNVSVAQGYTSEDLRAKQMDAVVKSALHLIENVGRVPVHVIACIEGRFVHEDLFTQAAMYGSVLQAAWSFQLALRARGLASAWTTFNLLYEKETAAIVGIPDNFTQTVFLPVAWLTGGDIHPAKRLPSKSLTYWNDWGTTR